MKCVEKGCNGEVDYQNPETVSFGCGGQWDLFPCNHCGRLYDKDGNVVNFNDERASLVDDEIVGILNLLFYE